MTVKKMPVAKLKIHPTNLDIYGDPDTELADTLEDYGLLQPLHITSDNLILSGGRRWAAADELGWKTIDAITVAPDDPELYILVANKYRDFKTDYTRLREGERYEARIAAGEDIGDTADSAEWPSERASHEAGFTTPKAYHDTKRVFSDGDDASKSSLARDIDDAHTDGKIDEQQHASLAANLAERQGKVRKGVLGGGEAANRTVVELVDAKRETKYSGDELAWHKAQDEFWACIKAGRKFNTLLSKLALNKKVHRHCTETTSFQLLGIAWHAKAILEGIAGNSTNIPLPRSPKQLEAAIEKPLKTVKAELYERA